MPDSISTLALRVDSQTALSNLNEFGLAAGHLGDVTDILKGKLLQLNSRFLSLNFAQSIVDDAAEGQEALGKFESVLGRFHDKATAVVDDLVANFNFDTASAQGAISGMVDTFVKAGMSLEQSLDMASQLNRRAADLEAFTNAQGGVAHVAEQLTSGALGNVQAVRSLGIVLSSEAIKTQIAKEKMEGFTASSARAAKMHATVALMLQQSASAEGQVASEADNYSNRLRFLKSRVADLRGSLGDALIPAFTKFVSVTAKTADAVNSLSPSAKAAIVGFGAVTGAAITLSPLITKLYLGFQQLSATRAIQTAVTEKQAAAEIEATSTVAAENAVLDANVAAETSSSAAAEASIVSKNAETAARLRNVQAIKTENKQLVSSSTTNMLSSPLSTSGTSRSNKSKIGDVALYSGMGNLSSGARELLTSGGKGSKIGSFVSKIISPFKKLTGIFAAFATRLPFVSKLGSIFSKVAAPLKTLTDGFSAVATKLPLVSKLGGGVARLFGLFGTGGAVIGSVVGAFEIFKRAPEWLEIAFDKAPEVFANLGKKSIDAVKNLTANAVNYGKDLIVQGTVGFAQTAKRLMGFETEASRAYKLNKQIEENNKKREELIAQETAQRKAENDALQAGISAGGLLKNAEIAYANSKMSDSVKLADATRNRDDIRFQLDSGMRRLARLQSDASNDKFSTEQRQEAAEQAVALASEIEQLSDDWEKAAEEVDRLSESVNNATKVFADDQKAFERSKKDRETAIDDANRAERLENAKTHQDRMAALQSNVDKATEDLELAKAAQSRADSLNKEVDSLQGRLVSPQVAQALSTIEELANSGDTTSFDAQSKWAGSLLTLEKAGYNLTDNDQIFSNGSARRLLGKMADARKNEEQTLTEKTQERDEAMSLAGETASRTSALGGARRALDSENNAFNQGVADEERQMADDSRRRNREIANYERGISDTYFNRQLKASDAYYSKDPLAAAQARYGLLDQRGEQDWTSSMAALEDQQAVIQAVSNTLNGLNLKAKNGTLTEDEAKQREQLKQQLDTLQTEFDSDYQSAMQRRLATEDELLGLQTTMRDEYIKQAENFVNERGASLKDQLVAEQEAERERLEERSKVDEEQRQIVSGQKAITAGSSEAFGIASRIYDRGQENLPPEKKIEKSTAQIEAYVKTMQESMLAYFTEQAGGLTLSMGY